MRILGLIVAVAVGALSLVSAVAQEKDKVTNQTSVSKTTDKIKELQRERIATLKLAAEVEIALFKMGMAGPEAMLEARVLVHEAELDAAEQDSERIAVLKSLIETLKELEDTARAKKLSAEGTEAAVLRIRARRLEAEIRLERVREKTNAS